MSHDVWMADFNKLADALLPWVRIDPEGHNYLTDDAPEGLTRPYRALLSIGYANGFLP